MQVEDDILYETTTTSGASWGGMTLLYESVVVKLILKRKENKLSILHNFWSFTSFWLGQSKPCFVQWFKNSISTTIYST